MPILDTPTPMTSDGDSMDMMDTKDRKKKNGDVDALAAAIKCMEYNHSVKIMNKIKPFPHTGLPFVKAKHVLTVPKLRAPIGVALLTRGRIAVSSTKDHKVAIIDTATGKVLSEIKAGLRRPSDLCTLPDGRLCVRDMSGIAVFDPDTGEETNRLNVAGGYKSFGLAQDGAGRIATIKIVHDVVMVLLHEVDTGREVLKVDISGVISDKGRSKCRFIFMTKKFLYIGDLGLNKIYMVHLKKGKLQVFGEQGSGAGQFVDPAGIAMDPDGAILVADAGNHRMLLFDRTRKFVCKVMTDKPLKRPSGLVYDPEEGAIYVLNLRGDSLSKFILD